MNYRVLSAVIVFALVLRIFLFSAYKMPSQSMMPQILPGDYVLASQVAYGFKLFSDDEHSYFKKSPSIGDLVVYVKSGKVFIKRVLAHAGDTVEYASAELKINSKPCRYSDRIDLTDGKNSRMLENCGERNLDIVDSVDPAFSPVLVSTKLLEGQFLVAGDNRSTEANPNPVEIITYDQIVGKPLLVWISYASTRDFISDTLGFRWNRILTFLK